MSLRSPLGKVLGTGSAKDGTGQWWAERVSALALIPLTLWFLCSVLSLPVQDYAAVRAWLGLPLNGFLEVVLLAVLTYHSYLGTNVIIEDYVHGNAMKLFSLLLLRFIYTLIGGASIFAVLRVVFGP
jgi:succinate dehydrogenase / fumarate reductase membrane anchor subunit